MQNVIYYMFRPPGVSVSLNYTLIQMQIATNCGMWLQLPCGFTMMYNTTKSCYSSHTCYSLRMLHMISFMRGVGIGKARRGFYVPPPTIKGPAPAGLQRDGILRVKIYHLKLFKRNINL